MKKYLSLLTILLICGCSTKPNDVPELYPTQVLVTNGTSPIAGADVVLGLISETSMCSMSGQTNSSGVAVIQTSRLDWRGDGAPAGDYIVTIAKSPKVEGELSVAEFQNLDPTEQERYSAEQARKYDALPRECPFLFHVAVCISIFSSASIFRWVFFPIRTAVNSFANNSRRKKLRRSECEGRRSASSQGR